MNKKTIKKSGTMKMAPPKKKTIDKNQLLAYLLALLIIFWTVAGVFGLIAFGRTSKKSSSSVISASAQTPESISQDGYLEIELPYIDGITTYDGYRGTKTFGAPKLLIMSNALMLKTHVLHSLGTGDTSISIYNVTTWLSSTEVGNVRVSVDDGPESLYIVSEPYETMLFPSLYEFDAIFLDYAFSYSNSLMSLAVEIDLRMDYDGVWYDYGFTIYYPYYSSPEQGLSRYSCPNFYADYAYDQVKVLKDTLGYGVPTAEFLAYYRLTNSLSPDAMLTYEMAYEKGFAEGKIVGGKQATDTAFAEGKNVGYREGKTDGLAEGKAIGFQEGVNSSNTYTFSNLLSSVFDVPVQTFASLFNFELLGINLLDFFLALFSAGAIIAIIRLFL